MRSLAAVSPQWTRFVLLADRIDGTFDPATEPFTLIEAGALPLPEVPKFIFRYTRLEFNTAIKPWFFRGLFEQGFDRVVYLDPDIFVYSPLDAVTECFDEGALAVLVPHLTGRLADARRPSEHDILQSGAYNLGFCALAKHRDLDALLAFWTEKSIHEFVVDLSRGLFTDQRWMDLVPGMFADVRILRHDGYDVAYWNLPHRSLSRHEKHGLMVNDVPLVFFHFSGFDPAQPTVFSKHQDRYQLDDLDVARDLTRQYTARLEANGTAECQKWPYAYGFLNDGSPIPDAFRRLYRTTPAIAEWAGADPYATTCAAWNEPMDDRPVPFTRPMLAVYQNRPDLRLRWPDVMGADRQEFARWFVHTSDLQALVPTCYVSPVREALNRERVSDVRRPKRRRSTTSIDPQLLKSAARKAYVAFREGRLRLSPVRWWDLFQLHLRENAQQQLAAAGPPLPSMQWQPSLGVNVVGYFSDPTGIGTAAQLTLQTCTEVGIASAPIDARSQALEPGPHAFNLCHVNADQMPLVARQLGSDFFRNRYTVGVWAWELPEFPDTYLEAFEYVDEVWAGSRFIQSAIADRSPVPVLHVPYVVSVSPRPQANRADWGLPSDRFLFLMMYDALSVQERKNPLGALAAFRQAFPSGRNVGLVIKVNHATSRAQDVDEVRRQVEQTEGAFLVDLPVSRQDAQSLQATCDAFVSLHRSEGFGLNIAESMLLGKPVVVTGWSGNMDFTTDRNACLVDYSLVTLERSYGPYPAGSSWAEPNLDHAASLMMRLVGDREFREKLATRGQSTVAAGLSPRAIGARYERRFNHLMRHLHQPGSSRSNKMSRWRLP
jgi:glycosyltransferase involved in cell wall biosynthesis